MITAHTAADIRATERPLIEAGEPLMARAAWALAGVARRMLREATGGVSGRRVLLLVGPGSNGGDALYAGAHLRERGVAVTALRCTERWHEDGAAAFLAAGGRVESLPALPRPSGGEEEGDSDPLLRLLRCDLVIDGILGTAGRPDLAPEIAAVCRRVNETTIPVLAVDLPSGMDATTGQHHRDTIAATCTLAIGSVAQGLLLPPGAEVAGRIEPLDIGLTSTLPEPSLCRLTVADLRALWPVPSRSATKYTRGVAGIVAGSAQFPGAAVLAASGALSTGAGMVRVLAPHSVVDLVLGRHPEVVGVDGRVQALLVGSGVPGDDARLEEGIERLVSGTRGVIDAGGLDALAEHWEEWGELDGASGEGHPGTSGEAHPGTSGEGHPGASGEAHPHASGPLHPGIVLTPHRAEAERLAAAVLPECEDPAALSARQLVGELARATGATVLLKGYVTLIAQPCGTLFSQADATPYLATAGAGDVLAGIITALLAQGIEPAEAAAMGACIHGHAAVVASGGGLVPITAMQVADRIPEALRTILG